MTRSTAFALALLLATLPACTQFRIRSEHDPSAHFQGLHTWAWLPVDQAAPADQRLQDRYVDRQLRKDVAAALATKGYREAAPEDGPDFFVNYRLSTQPGEQLHGSPDVFLHGPGWGMWTGAGTVYSEGYDEGTLYLAVLDTRTKRMVWIGAAEARLLPHLSYERRIKRVGQAVHQILERFPPP